ncbi:MAG: pteridine reductase [Candidatus Deianiraeaceae bacterium]|jgi:pteridine reductase
MVILITGSAKRIGLSIARFCAGKGYDVAMHCNSSRMIAEIEAEKIRKDFKVKCEVFECDLSNTEKIPLLFAEVLKVFTQIDVLINNASIFTKSSILNIEMSDMSNMFNIHLFSPALLCKVFALQNNMKHGLIINFLDKNINRAKTKYFAYLHSKKSLWELTQYLAVELAPNVRTNAISPGFIIEEEGAVVNKEYMDSQLESIPLKRQGSVDDIIHAVEYLMDNKYVNGQNLYVDGGAFLVE